MDFYSIVTIVALVLLVIALLIYGLAYKSLNSMKFPESQDPCPSLWKSGDNGYCINPLLSDCYGMTNSQCNRLSSIPSDTPGKSNNDTFDPLNSGWDTYQGSKNSFCGKKKWANNNGILWNGINNYQC